jgi:hypothetical protein
LITLLTFITFVTDIVGEIQIERYGRTSPIVIVTVASVASPVTDFADKPGGQGIYN